MAHGRGRGGVSIEPVDQKCVAHVADRNTVDRLADYFYHKYEWDFRYDETAVWRLIEITPHKIMAWGDGYETDGVRIL